MKAAKLILTCSAILVRSGSTDTGPNALTTANAASKVARTTGEAPAKCRSRSPSAAHVCTWFVFANVRPQLGQAHSGLTVASVAFGADSRRTLDEPFLLWSLHARHQPDRRVRRGNRPRPGEVVLPGDARLAADRAESVRLRVRRARHHAQGDRGSAGGAARLHRAGVARGRHRACHWRAQCSGRGVHPV